VPPNKGVLVRAVEKGTPGASAGLKAGDVIVKVNNEDIHDMADWKRSLNGKGKLSVTVVRDKREQNLQMNLPPNTSGLKDWDSFEQDMQELAAEMQLLGPEFERNAREMAKLDPKQFDEIRRQAEEAARTVTPQMQKQAERMSKQMAKMTPEMTLKVRELTDAMMPNAEQMSKMARDMAEQWKLNSPELRKQMQEFEKQMEEQQREWEKNFEWSTPKQL